MTTYNIRPRLLKGAFVSVNSDGSGGQTSVVVFQYNPAALTRTLEPQMVGGDEGERSEEVRFTRAPVETINLDAEIDAIDQMEAGQGTSGIYPQLAALELLAYPTTAQVRQTSDLASQGAMSVIPMNAPLTLFVWGPQRVLPVRLTSYSISEEAFDARLNPIRANVTLNMRVLTYSDLAIGTKGYGEFYAHQRKMESIAKTATGAGLSSVLGVSPSSI
jgi:hypothetical protein